ncbi:hypothetical protein ACFT8P_35220 [Streptomyces sp. NPDC057101]|uniref:hypothetical protein n=1 Tax=Streptomyces sp. NPDC057101 TaxID=3346020 RepID=UPI00363C27D7
MSEDSYWLNLAAAGDWEGAALNIQTQFGGDLADTEYLKSLVSGLHVPEASPEAAALHLAVLEATFLGCMGAHDHWRWLRYAAVERWDLAVEEARIQLEWINCSEAWLQELAVKLTGNEIRFPEDAADQVFNWLLKEMRTPDEFLRVAYELIEAGRNLPIETEPAPSSSRSGPSHKRQAHNVRRKTKAAWEEIERTRERAGSSRKGKTVDASPERKKKSAGNSAFETDLSGRPQDAADFEPAASSSRRDKGRVGAVKEVPAAPNGQESGNTEQAEKTISSPVRTAITKLNIHALDRLTQEGNGGGDTAVRFVVFHPIEGGPVLQIDADNTPNIKFTHTYSGSLSIPSKGTRNPFTALRRRAKKEHVRGDIAVTSNDPEFDHTEVEGLLRGITKKTVNRRYESARAFLVTGTGTPEWNRVKEHTERHLMGENTEFIEAVQRKMMPPAELFRIFVADGAAKQANINNCGITEELKSKDRAGSLNYADFNPAVTAIVNMLLDDVSVKILIKELTGAE